MTPGLTTGLFGAALALALAATACDAAERIRIGIYGAPEGCAGSTSGNLSPAMSAYLRHLNTRLESPVEICGVVSGEAATALASGRIDLVRVISGPGVAMPDTVRPIMRVRPRGQLARTEFVIVAPRGTERLGPGAPDATNVTPLAANTSEAESMAAILPQVSEVTPVESSMESAMDTVLTAVDDSSRFAINVGRYRVFCQESEGTCDGFTPIWRGFPPVESAWCVRKDTDKELRYRLIGIHAVLHEEAPEAFSAIAGPDADAFAATEPWAFRFENTLD